MGASVCLLVAVVASWIIKPWCMRVGYGNCFVCEWVSASVTILAAILIQVRILITALINCTWKCVINSLSTNMG